MDYDQTDDHLYNKFICKCLSNNCRCLISGKLEIKNKTINIFHLINYILLNYFLHLHVFHYNKTIFVLTFE